MSKSALIKSSIAKKYWMGATGLFLCLFLIGHLAGNLQLFISGEEGQLQFNEYAKFMTTNPAVKILSYVTYVSILFHAIDGLILTIQNRRARPVKYAYKKDSANSAWSSRNMGILGTVILVFIVVHMQNFWWRMHFDKEIPMQTMGPDGNVLEEPLKDLHTVVLDFFNPGINDFAIIFLIIYVIAQLAIAFHLSHGFASGFQSLGANHPKYNPFIKGFGKAFSVVIPILFASIPIYLYVSQMS